MRISIRCLPLLLVALAGCHVGVFYHDEHIAAHTAEAFAQVAFVEQNIPRAYTLLDPTLRAERTEAAFAELVRAMHPNGRPQTVLATSFEPVPGTATIQIYLDGHSGDGSGEVFYDRLLMQGSALGGYRTAGLFRRNEPYPASTLRRSL